MEAIDKFVKDYWGVIITLAVAAIHAYTFGPVLTYGSLVDSVQVAFNNTYNNVTLSRLDAVMVGDFQYGAFIFAGIFLKAWNVMLGWCGVDITNPWVFRIHTFGFSTLWTLGMFLAPFVGNSSYNVFAGTYIGLGGLGSGLLFWHSLSALRSWFRDEDMVATNGMFENLDQFTLAFLTVSIAPAVYQSMYASVYTLTTDHWFNMKILLAAVGTAFVFVSGAMLTIRRDNDDDEAIQTTVESFNSELNADKVWRGHFPIYLAAGLYQFSFYAPFIALPQFVKVVGGGADEQRMILSVLGAGAITGKLVAFVIDRWYPEVGVTTFYMLLSTIPLAVWSAPGLDVGGLYAVAFFLGLMGAATSHGVFLHLLGAHNSEKSVQVVVNDFQTKVALLCVCLSFGAWTSALIAERVQANYKTNAYTGYGMVGALLALFAASAAFVMIISLVFCRCAGPEHYDDDDESVDAERQPMVVDKEREKMKRNKSTVFP